MYFNLLQNRFRDTIHKKHNFMTLNLDNDLKMKTSFFSKWDH